MGLDKNNIPDEYLCEVCKPRPVDRKRAKAMQARRRSEIFKDSSSSDDEKRSKTDKKRPSTAATTGAGITLLFSALPSPMI